MKTYGHFIDGDYVAPSSGKLIDSFNPYSVWISTAEGAPANPFVLR